MDDSKEIKDQIMTRILQQPHIATDVISGHTPAIFGDNAEYNTIARVAIQFYYHNQQKLDKQTLNTILASRMKILTKQQVITTSQEAIQYFHDADRFLSGKINTSDSMTNLVNNYIRSHLGGEQILKKVADYQQHPHTYDLVAHTMKALSNINSLDITGQNNQVIDVFNPNDFSKEHEALKELNKDKVPMGLSNMDQATYQGLAKGEVGLIGASSGHGKTTVLSNFSIDYIKQGYNVFHVSLEELASQMLLRFARISLGIVPEEIFDHHGHVNKFTVKVIDSKYRQASKQGKIGHLFFYRTSPRTMTVDDLRELILSVERLKGIKFDVVTIDYPDLLLNTYNTGNESEDGGRLFQDIRKMAQDLNVVCWTATQLNRMATSQDVKTLSSAEGSYRKINTVEFAGTVNNSDAEWQNGFMRINIDKLRNRNDYGGLCLYFKYDPPTMQLKPENSEELDEHKALINEDTSDSKMTFRKNKSNSGDSRKATADKINQWNKENG